MNGLDVESVTVAYEQGSFAVRDVSLTVDRGDVVALLGPSGSGKSTLLRAIAGLEPLDRGRMRWDGVDLAGIAPHRRGFGLVFQDGQLFVHRTVAGNIAYGLRVQRVPQAARRQRVRELLALVGLEGMADRRVTELSGGERQRVALARALAPSPRLLLLDEPLSALDRALRDRLAHDLAHILRETSTTAIFVTHDETEAHTVAGRIERMHDGQLVTEHDGSR